MLPNLGMVIFFLLSFRQEIQTSTSSMTWFPKPLKFLRPHYATLKAYYETMVDLDSKVLVVWLGTPLLFISIILTYLICILLIL